MFKLEQGWLTVALLCAMIVVAGGGVAAASWTDSLQAAWICGVIGVFAGLALARSRFNGFTAFLFATVYGIFITGFFIALDLKGGRDVLLRLVESSHVFLQSLRPGTARRRSAGPARRPAAVARRRNRPGPRGPNRVSGR